ncbi:MAG: hypothetical protein CMP05_04950 [Xanthomarina sp.]|uniref:DUF6588 family protein n=1 Tax=Xanthomarina TaxID=1868329 RepID=UPI000C4E6791|nr:DUF6588 family protein [Xanthomarina sp.]MAL22122.1 hypothetical protein [Xanthomarina sp.]MBF61330.1 hypothetical protein [Xanthomarina sp.]HAB27181.1 hypothetical protein [Xanthomarina gelatinilytica]|tara:strand:+ start:247 stop:1260 length:1014 start_codon:yes stop_codon:yes gene_type:complete
MKTIPFFLFLIIIVFPVQSQDNIDDLLAAGVNDAKRFSQDYLAPATEGLAYGINNGWFNHAKGQKQFGFEIGLIANTSFINDDKKTFEMRASDYENIRFLDNSTSKNVATALGHNDPDITVVITYDDPIFGNQETELTLPTGIGSTGVNIIPAAFLQAAFSPFRGTQIKARYFPKIETEDVKTGLYGVGIQQEFTAWLPRDKFFPVAISGLIAYTHLDGSYDFTDSNLVEGSNQQVQTDINTFLFELIGSTNFKVLNAYGAIGYLSGKSQTDLLGTYVVTDGLLYSESIVDPFSIEEKVNGIRTTLGANVKLGFFSLNVDYTFAEFNSASLGLNFSF